MAMMWFVGLGALCAVAAIVAVFVLGRGAPVQMIGGETILIPTQPTKRARRRWRITIERN